MIKKIIVIALVLALFCWSLTLVNKTEQENIATPTDEQEPAAHVEEALPDTVFSFNTQNLTSECSEGLSDMLCAVENAVKSEVKKLSMQLAPYKRPINIVVRQESLPRTATSKIKRKEVKKLLCDCSK